MTTEERLEQLEEEVKDLKIKSIKVNLEPTERENIKNAVFDGYAYASFDGSGTTNFIKTTWKNKVVYFPYYTSV